MTSLQNLHGVAGLVAQIIDRVGDCSARAELLATPSRVEAVLADAFRGYGLSPAAAVKTFAASSSETDFVYVRDVFVSSYCEHHMMPFFGKLDLVYAPADTIIGLSKVVDFVGACSSRLQTQERLTRQVLDGVKRLLRPRSLGVALTCKHTCMMTRRVRSVCSEAVTFACCGQCAVSSSAMTTMTRLLLGSLD